MATDTTTDSAASAPGPAPAQPAESAKQPRPRLGISDNAKAVMELRDPAGAITMCECSRNLVEILNELRKRLPEEPKDALKNWAVAVWLPAEDLDAKQPVKLDLVRGNGEEAYAQLQGRTVNAEQAMLALRRFLAELCEVSDLRGMMVTGVFSGAGVGGFTVLNNVTGITNDDIIRLGEGAEGQALTFKVDMGKRGVEFKADAPQIITPDQVRQMAAHVPGGKLPPFPGGGRRRG